MEQREKLATILAGVLAEWNKPKCLLVVFGAEKAGDEEEESKGGVDWLLEYFGLVMDADEILGSMDFLAERVATRLELRWVSLATVAIMRQLKGTLSPEQVSSIRSSVSSDSPDLPINYEEQSVNLAILLGGIASRVCHNHLACFTRNVCILP